MKITYFLAASLLSMNPAPNQEMPNSQKQIEKVATPNISKQDNQSPQSSALMETFPVVLQPKEQTVIYASPDVTTRVAEVNKKMGDSFRKGDLLIRFDNDIYKANVSNAKRALEKAELETQVKQELYEDHIASPLEVMLAKAAEAKAKSEYVFALHQLRDTEIRGEYDGKVVTVDVHPWEYPKSGKPIIELVSDKKLLAILFIPSTMLQIVKFETLLYIWIRELNEILTAKVTRLGAVINPASSTIKIEAEIDNANGRLKSGMSGIASFSKQALEYLLKPGGEENSP